LHDRRQRHLEAAGEPGEAHPLAKPGKVVRMASDLDRQLPRGVFRRHGHLDGRAGCRVRHHGALTRRVQSDRHVWGSSRRAGGDRPREVGRGGGRGDPIGRAHRVHIDSPRPTAVGGPILWGVVHRPDPRRRERLDADHRPRLNRCPADGGGDNGANAGRPFQGFLQTGGRNPTLVWTAATEDDGL